MRIRSITSRTSASVSIARAAIFVECGLTGWGPTRPWARSSAPTSRGKPKCATRSPWRCPIWRPSTVKAHSPRRPTPASTPGQAVTASVISLLALRVSVMPGTLQVQVSLKSRAGCAELHAMSSLLTIGEVARRSGVAASALRYYEERGLIRSERAGAGHRRYPRAVLRRIAFVVFAQRIGLTLDEIGAELAKLPGDRAPTRREWSRLSSTWTSRIDERIGELERLRLGLTECIGCGCLSLDRCQLANPGDRAAPVGAGGAHWGRGR